LCRVVYFAATVRQHADWVYSAALRIVASRADLSRRRDAGGLPAAVAHPDKARGKRLSGWLFAVTKYCASAAMRAEDADATRSDTEAAAAMTSEHGVSA
jgi:hypothetical protein